MLERFVAALNFMGLTLSNEREIISEHASFFESKAFERAITVFKKMFKKFDVIAADSVIICKGFNSNVKEIACDGNFVVGFEVGTDRRIYMCYENLDEYVFETYSEDYIKEFYDSMSSINKIGIDISGAHHEFLSSYLALQIFRMLDELCIVSLNSVDYSDIEEILENVNVNSKSIALKYSDKFVALVIDLDAKNSIKSKQVFYAKVN